MDDSKFKYTIPAELSKAEDGEWKVRGLASTESRDQQGEVMRLNGMDLTAIDKKRATLNFDHKPGPENTIGLIDGYSKTKEGLYIEGRLFKNHDKAKAVYQIMSSLGKSDYGRVGLSVEGAIKERAGKDGTTIKRSVITAVALTLNPVNTDTYVNLAKSLNATELEFDLNSNKEFKSSDVKAPGEISEPSYASREAQGSFFTANQVVEIVAKALSVGAERASTTPGNLSGGAALAKEDLDKKKKDVKSEGSKETIEDILEEAPMKKGSSAWFQKSILEALDSLQVLYPGVKPQVLLDALRDRLNTKYGVDPS